MAGREKGYTIEIDQPHQILKLHLWGLWDQKLAQQFEQEAKTKILEISRTAPQGWRTLVDLSQFPPQLPEIQNMTKAVMMFEVAHGMKKAATVLAPTMTKLQVQRLAKAEGLDPGSFFQSEEAAIQWLVQA